MKRLFLASFIFFMCTSAAGKEPPRDDDPNFNALMQKVSEAEWLATYDRIAWASTDSLRQSFADGEMPAMGPDWFCYDDKRGFWHAVYGSYDPVNNRYEQAFHYRTNGSGMLKQIKAKADSSLTNPVSRAMRTARACPLPIVSGIGITFNPYAR